MEDKIYTSLEEIRERILRLEGIIVDVEPMSKEEIDKICSDLELD